MHEFFHGWQRKVGCVTLVMALAVCAMWIRNTRHHQRDAPHLPSPTFEEVTHVPTSFVCVASPYWSAAVLVG